MKVKSVSESQKAERVAEATGKSRDEWFEILRTLDVGTIGHTVAASILVNDYGVGSWWSQQIVIDFEQAEGLRKPGQRSGGKFAVNVSRTLNRPIEECLALIASPDGWNKWFTHDAEIDLREGGHYRTGDGDKGRVLRVPVIAPANSYGERARFEFTWEHPRHTPGSRVAIQLIEKGPDKIQVALTHDRIAFEEEMLDLKAGWTTALDQLRDSS
ncbi:MAG TPA: SRPBCC domain-containing protein [Fimbriimonadaceae bacterium]|nr:SRPBCC domain-containing protein [Fimbriimonadaceae bacterium]